MRLSIAVRELHPRRAFRIARVRRNPVCNVFVRLEANGISGFGEASPNAFYNEAEAQLTFCYEMFVLFFNLLEQDMLANPGT